MDTSTMCPECMQENAMSAGYCRFCKKKINLDIPAGVLPPGVVLHGHYITGAYLGNGGFGTIYRGLETGSRRIVAIKEYFPSIWCHRQLGRSGISITSQEEYEYGLKHFYGEIEILRALQGIPEVVRLYDSFAENNTSYYVMEFLEGETLQHYLRSHRDKIAFSAAVTLLMPVILGMRKVHQAGTTHRDISPDNIFLCRDGSVRIIDFGASAAKDSKLSNSFIPVEKEGYSPPEQHTISSRGDTQGTWSDVYAMAGTLYRCTVGKRPPSASTRQAGDPLEFERSGLTPQQVAVLTKNLSLKPAERCRDMLSFARELLGCLKEGEAALLCGRYPELQTSEIPVIPGPSEDEPPSVRTERPPQPAQTGEDTLLLRQFFAYLLDMLFFQAFPFALGQLIGGPTLLWLLLGLTAGIVTTWLMTASAAGGSPGEILCGLEVAGRAGRPDQRDALLRCLIRIFWLLKPAEGVYWLVSKTSLNTALSGCRSLQRGRAPQPPSRELALVVTDGLYKGSTIPLSSGRYVFGRNPELCNLVFPLAYNVVSKVHLEIVVDAANNIFITDQSRFGTWVDNRKLNPGEVMKAAAGATIAFGREQMVITYV